MIFESLWRRLHFLLRRSRYLAELDEETRLHLELRERQLQEQGLSPAEATRLARLQFGNRTSIREESQEVWGWGWLDGLYRDLRHGLRLLRANPLFATVVVVTLALGIGPNVAMFSVMNAIVIRHLPVPEPDRLVYLRTSRQPEQTSNTGNYGSSFSYPVFSQLREQREAFSDLMAFVPLGLKKTAVRHGAIPEEANAHMVSGNFFTGLGVGARCGRLITPEDETSRAPVVVLSHSYWTRRFGGDCAVVGQRLEVKGVPFTIVGVVAAEQFLEADLWIPLQERVDLNAWGMREERGFMHDPHWWCLLLIGRLAPGISQQEALARLQPPYLNAAYAGLRRPASSAELPVLSFTTTRGVAELRDSFDRPLRLLLGMVTLVLIIACANAALLLIARNTTRQREFAIRVALGGGRQHLLRQMLAESLLLVGSAAAVGWGFALVATQALRRWTELPIDLAPDRGVLLFTLAVSALVTLVFGLAPMRSLTRAPMLAGLRTGSVSGLPGRAWGRRVVVALQVALCLVLLMGAGLLVRTLGKLEQIPLGMRAGGLLVFGLSPQQRASTHAATVLFYEDLLRRLRALPGVESVTLMQNRIGSGWSNNTQLHIDGQSALKDRPGELRWNSVGPDYLRTLDIPLLAGRELDDGDRMGTDRVAVVNETFVKRYLPDGNPLGRSIALGPSADADRYRIVGVAADSKYTGIREAPRPMAYFSYKQRGHVSAVHVELRTAGAPDRMLPLVQKTLRDLAPDLPLEEPRTQSEEFARTLLDDRLFARLGGFFGLLAILLVATGLYGTLAYAVNQRTAEIGVRVALGAQRGSILWLVLREGLAICAVGLAFGLPLALAGSHLLRASLYGVTPGDPVALMASLLGLVGVAIVASLVPAHRASSVPPTIALRAE
jgi:predicted permease